MSIHVDQPQRVEVAVARLFAQREVDRVVQYPLHILVGPAGGEQGAEAEFLVRGDLGGGHHPVRSVRGSAART